MLRKITLIAAGILFTLVAFAVTRSAQDAKDASVVHNNATNINNINDKVKRLNGNDPVAIGELVDSVLSFHGITKQVLSGASGMRDHLVNTEIDYHSGKRRGVSETSIVRLINNLAIHFKTPEYTQTSTLEVRQLRMQMLAIHPGLIGIPPVFKQREVTNRALKDEMSPVEAIHVTATMIFQKLNNPEWQLSRSERRARWQEKHQLSYRPNFGDQTRSGEVLKAIQNSISQMSMRDGLTISNESLSILGIGGNNQ
jgi:hypothetical protein